jgi:NAD(P)-dependent dehydrogenase (short-subunit alcohol dehydrogenase family)
VAVLHPVVMLAQRPICCFPTLPNSFIAALYERRLARDGYAITVNCVVNRDLAAGVVREIEASGGRAIWMQADVSDGAAVRRLFDATEEAFGGVDVVVSNSGIMRLAPFAEMADADFDRMIEVNVKGSFNVLREAARRVRDGVSSPCHLASHSFAARRTGLTQQARVRRIFM